MAKLFIDQTEYEIPNGASISAACEQAGIPMNCHSGVCGSCQVKVIEGAKNLNKLTPEEIELGMDENSRLSCMCFIKKGVVKITRP
ncbi:MAG: 2Fe-2S iron-sulfur cluster-binding protein [Candidatus Omnitrophota bacterium]